MSNPPVIAEPFYEFDVEFSDETLGVIYMPGDTDNLSNTAALAIVIYDAILAASNIKMVSQNLWGEDAENSFTSAAVPPPPPHLTYHPET